ncbi:N-acetylglutamate synthase-like GNAT family acetyltransferase [Pedobacter sp. W3I1]|uniref:GNAT family N-acetyltransferase n=1 Tax=Pedobacter sp. W3I1 TaxID=3042291 RepID=UPI002781AA81|nr:GNAT family N-acetyltransferase [Pedobacter sp. W3I1]MDQ0638263.1 N-acetylglutamate synthase-like GNAT family acetyltransferase [Pedobacter sp. W3I1]
MNITYKLDIIPDAEEVIALFSQAGLKRPTDPERITLMLKNADLLVTAWQEDKLVGISRTITDWAWCAYLADLAVFTDLKSSGIGKEMIAITREKIGPQCMLILLSVPTAFDYYPKVGFNKEDRAFSIERTQ